tara:strand:+ start:142 stop:492 length:351 start_codon:yes stop_codon:yes gene_type:complete
MDQRMDQMMDQAAATSDAASDVPVAPRTEIPPIISVDDHIVEPPHLWKTWLPAKYRDRGPRVERRRLGDMTWVGGAKMYEYELDAEDAPWCDVWFYEDLYTPTRGTWRLSASTATR